MSKGISASISHLVDRVEALTPKSDSYHTFLCVLDASGRSQSLESRSNQNRLFDFKFQSLAQDDGQAGRQGHTLSVLHVGRKWGRAVGYDLQNRDRADAA